jgi:hypothetical protein
MLRLRLYTNLHPVFISINLMLHLRLYIWCQSVARYFRTCIFHVYTLGSLLIYILCLFTVPLMLRLRLYIWCQSVARYTYVYLMSFPGRLLIYILVYLHLTYCSRIRLYTWCQSVARCFGHVYLMLCLGQSINMHPCLFTFKLMFTH